MSILDERMNAEIDAIIAKLQEAKKTKTYFQRANAVKAIVKDCEDYEFYWTDRLESLMD